MEIGIGLGVCFSGLQPTFAPNDVANLALWVDATKSEDITESAGKVSQWNDRSGSGNNLVQATGAKQPTTGTRTMNGKNVIHAAAAEFLQKASFTITPSMTFFLVTNEISSASAISALMSMDATNDFQIDSAILGEFHFRNNNTVGTVGETVGDFLGTPTVMSGRFDTTTNLFYCRINGADEYNTDYTINLDTSMVLSLGTNRPQNDGVEADFGEFMFYNRSLSTAEILDVEGYLMSKWIA